MQNTVQTSTMLQNYIQAVKSTETMSVPAVNSNAQNLQTNIENNLEKQPETDKFETQEQKRKREISKKALIATGIISLAVIGELVFKNRNGIMKSFKKLASNVRNFFTNNETVTNVTNNAQELTKGADNITNGKDSFVRHFLMKIPGYEKFDNWASNIYRNSMKGTMTKKWQKAAEVINQTDDEILSAARKTDLDEGLIQKLEGFITRRKENLASLSKKENVAQRVSNLDNSMARLDIEGWEALKDIRPSNIKDKISQYSRSSIVKNGVEKANEAHMSVLGQFEHLGLSGDEVKEFEDIVSKVNKKSGGDLTKHFKKANKIFNNTYQKESIDLLEKLRDVNCGSAPTDLQGIGMTLGLLGIYAAQADTKEERTGVALTTGIPLIATLGTTMAATVKMVSGAKALGLGLISGFIANRIGGAINKHYQKAHNSENAPKTVATVDDCIKSNPFTLSA